MCIVSSLQLVFFLERDAAAAAVEDVLCVSVCEVSFSFRKQDYDCFGLDG